MAVFSIESVIFYCHIIASLKFVVKLSLSEAFFNVCKKLELSVFLREELEALR